MANPITINVFKEIVFQYIHKEVELQTLDSHCAFSEGPVWHPAGYYLFSDIPQNFIKKVAPGITAEVYLKNSGCKPGNTRDLSEQVGSNGLAFDKDDRLYICQHGNGAVATYDGNGLQDFITNCNGKVFNSPNDVVVHADGTVFFSDPPYGLKNQQLQPQHYQPLAGLYCWREGVLRLITDAYQYPNGVCLSPDGNSLYACSNKSTEAFVLEFDAVTLALKRTVCKETSDGIKCDRFGNLYLCNKEGILIINKDGERLALIQLPAIPANCCWGGPDMNDLLITAREYIFLIPDLQKK